MTIWVLSKEYYAPGCYSNHCVVEAYYSLRDAMHAAISKAEKHDAMRVYNSSNNVMCEYSWWTEDFYGDDVQITIRVTELSINN